MIATSWMLTAATVKWAPKAMVLELPFVLDAKATPSEFKTSTSAIRPPKVARTLLAGTGA
ncbi:hypothetical protein BELL_1486g00020 [Botrytis elliptica]|uniref:Uncharacterized protein n=1 Tax=Botrytis elliptica TaxID=278938 RepID=A0A4Z1I7U4_9HELO|nr:hypothetical protein BELL_1486g00020 [Botrytis elliptica]